MQRILDECAQECRDLLDGDEVRAAHIVQRRWRGPDDTARVFRYLISHGFSAACAQRVLQSYGQL